MRALGLACVIVLVTLDRPARAEPGHTGVVAAAIDTPSWAVNAVLGDQSWTGPGPAGLARPQARIAAHLRLVLARLRAADVSTLPASAQAARRRLIGALAGYTAAGVFPRRTDDGHDGWRPRFIDDRGVPCAVGFLMIESGHGALAQELDARAEYAFVRDLIGPAVLAWAAAHGFSTDELAMIQPQYHPPTTREAMQAALEYTAPAVAMNCAPKHGPRADVRVKARVPRRGRPTVRVVGTDAFARCATRVLQRAPMISPRAPTRPFRVDLVLPLPTLETIMAGEVGDQLTRAASTCWPSREVGVDARATITIGATATVSVSVAGKNPDTEYCLVEALRGWAGAFVSTGPAFTLEQSVRLGPPAPR